MLTQSTCLHLPPLYEESTARIAWESVDDALGYELDTHFDEDFKAALTGRSWQDIDEAGLTWGEVENHGLTWTQFEALSAQGLSWLYLDFLNLTWEQIEAGNPSWKNLHERMPKFTTYRGAGEKTPGPDQGFTWQNIDSVGLAWGQIDALSWTWEDFELQPSIGLTWAQLDRENPMWTQIEVRDWTWYDFEHQAPYGLNWGSLDGRYLTWTQIEGQGLTWEQFENLPADAKTHIAHIVEIPLYKKKAIFRVRAYKDGEYSEYLTSTLTDTLPRSLAKYKPPCIHVPELHEGRSADIVWSDLYGASGYVLERKLGAKEYSKIYDGPGRAAAHPAGCTTVKDFWYTPDGKQHFAYTDQIPYYEKTATYRIKGYNTTDHSQYLQSVTATIIPVFYREDSIRLDVKAGTGYFIQLHVKDIADFENILMTMQYSASILRLDNLVWNEPASKSDLCGKFYTDGIRNTSLDMGQVKFYSTKPMRSKNSWGGFLFAARFTALQTTTAQVQLY